MKIFKKLLLSFSILAAVPLPIVLSSCNSSSSSSESKTEDDNNDNKDDQSDSNQNGKDNNNPNDKTDDQSDDKTDQNPSKPAFDIKDVVTLVKSAMRVFNTWDLFPSSFSEENRVVSYTQQDFSQNVTLANITDRGIGKQMNQFITIATNIETVIKGAKIIFDSTTLIANMYKTFFDKGPEKNKVYESSTEKNEVKFKVELTDTTMTIFAKAQTASAEFYLNLNDGSYSGRLQLSDGNALKYEISKNLTKIGIKALGAVRMMFEVDTSNSSQKIAKLFNYYGTNNDYKDNDESDGGDDIGITTCSVMAVDKNYVSIIGKKGDFLSWSKENRNMEVYDAKTGNYLGSKVHEELSKLKYMTNWYPFQSISGFNSIKQVTNSDNKNDDGFYLNGLSSPFQTTKTISSTTGYSRMYDIEMKKVYLYQNKNNNIDKFSVTIPMLFMQDTYETNSSKGFKELNEKNPGLNLANTTSQTLKTYMINEYDTLNNQYNAYNETVQNTTVDSYVGTQNSWFNA
ncbi:MAG: hypothetical protein K2O21_01175 [Malacoplasma sp.]|nr:hypothetical protein [Malacoplasma sp.]